MLVRRPVSRQSRASFTGRLNSPRCLDGGAPGFDVVLANPPWEKLKVERHDFFQRFIPSLKRIESAAAREKAITKLIEKRPDVEERYEREQRRVSGLKPYFRPAAGNYRLHGAGDADLFKAFAERFMQICRSDGAVGCVLPRPLVSGGGSEALRREYFTNWSVRSMDMVWNQRRWVFPGINDRVQCVLLAARKRVPNPGQAAIATASPLNSEERFRQASRATRQTFGSPSSKNGRRPSSSHHSPTRESGRVFEKMLRHPRFDNDSRSWRALPYCELHSTADKDLYNESGEGWPVWKGNTFDRYRPDIAEPVYWAEAKPVLERLQEKRLRSRGVFDDFPDEVLRDPSTLPPHECRIVFRDVVRATDRRTMKACLAPPRVFAMEKSPQLVWPRGDHSDALLLLAVLNSLPFDWVVRRRVETKVSFGILNSLPIPDTGDSKSRLIELAGAPLMRRQALLEVRFRSWAGRSGLGSGRSTRRDGSGNRRSGRFRVWPRRR